MRVVVNDANILIDLIKLQMLEAFFSLDGQFHVTDLIIENELYEQQKACLQPFIESGQLCIQELSAADLLMLMQLQAERPTLSDKDCSALLYAQKLKAMLITSDNPLRKFATQKGIEVHGHLWVFDELVQEQRISPSLAIKKLKALATINPRLRLPEKECNLRIELWELI
jgi:predicted nucleic acid-binding protein